MRLGIEARWLGRGPDSGRTLITGLLNGLIKLVRGSGHTVVLYVDRRDASAIQARFPQLPELSFRGLWFWNRRLTVEHCLGRMADGDRLDVLLTQAFTPYKCNAKRVVYVLDLLFESHPQFFTKIEHLYFHSIRGSCGRADRIVAISHFTKSQITTYGYAKPDKVEVVYCGAQTAHQSNGVLKSLPARYFLYVGRLNDRKNIATILKAGQKVLEETDAHLLIVGTPSGKLTTLDETTLHTLRNRIHFLGHVPDASLPELYRHALAFVYIPFAEGFGLPVIEAMSYGIPAVVSSGSGVTEAAGSAGYTVDPHSPDQVAEAMRLLASDTGLRDRLSREALRQAALFSWDDAAHKVWDLCREISGR